MLWGITLVGAALLAVLCFELYRLMLWSIGSSIGRRHKQLQHVLETRNPCPAWVAPQRDKSQQRDHCLRRLDHLLQYVRQSPMLADEPTRQTVIGELESIRQEWNRPDWIPSG